MSQQATEGQKDGAASFGNAEQPQPSYQRTHDSGQVLSLSDFQARAGLEDSEPSQNIRLFATGIDIQQVAQKVF